MNKIFDLHSMPKGSECEIKGEIIFENPPKAVRYGTGLNQFVVLSDHPDKGLNAVGVNISVQTVEDGFTKGEKIVVKGKVDKYPDRNQPLKPDGTYPVKTSVKATHVEKFVEVEDFAPTPEESVASVMSPQDIEEVNKPPTNGYSTAKGVEEEKKRIMWEKKDLVTAKESACKTVGKWIDSGKIELKDYFKWCDYLVDYFYNSDDKFALITEANLMQSGLITVNKAQALAWIEEHAKGTDVAQDLCGILHVKALDKQTLNELLETIGKLSLAV